MFRAIRHRISRGINALKKSFLQQEGLPFNEILSQEYLQQVVIEEVGEYRDRIFPPMVTLTAFISQILSEDHSCRDTVARVRADQVARGETPCSAATGAYCKARKRLPNNLIWRVMRETGQTLHASLPTTWKWKGRDVILADGTTVSMPDTLENQEAFPQPDSQKPGLGFPIARLVGLISLSSGSVLDAALGPYQGKETGEHALLRQMLDTLSAGDVLLADRYYCSYFLIAILQTMNVDVVFQNHASRKSDDQRGQRLGKRDHMVIWSKPQRPDWMDEKTYQAIPERISMREVKHNQIVIVTTLLEHEFVTRREIIELYSKRWNIEVDLKFIKEVLQMDILRCKTPLLVHKEIGVHLLAYNLIRTVMAQAAHIYGGLPRTISFKGTLQSLNAFQDKILLLPSRLPELYEALLQGIVSHRIGNRPGRNEPRAVKRRPKPFPRLTEPRKIIRSKLVPTGNIAYA